MIKEYNETMSQVIRQSERKSKPTKKDYAEAEVLFKDFCVGIKDIPTFDTVAQLQQYVKEQIRKRLDGKE